MAQPLVGIIMGSKSDLPVMQEAAKILEQFKVAFEMNVLSAHRSPELASAYAKAAQKNGLKVIIAGAGGAAHLAGVVAAHTVLPVIGVPVASKLSGFDSLLSTVQMPGGVPVATVGVDNAKNAGILAVQMLALSDAHLAKELLAMKAKMAEEIKEMKV